MCLPWVEHANFMKKSFQEGIQTQDLLAAREQDCLRLHSVTHQTLNFFDNQNNCTENKRKTNQNPNKTFKRL